MLTGEEQKDMGQCLLEADKAINHFKDLGKVSIPPKLINGELPSTLQSLEHFPFHVYSSKGPTNLCLLRWELFLSKNLEGEMLPPTRAALAIYPLCQLRHNAG